MVVYTTMYMRLPIVPTLRVVELYKILALSTGPRFIWHVGALVRGSLSSTITFQEKLNIAGGVVVSCTSDYIILQLKAV